jgi:hypothetical protein
LLDATHRSGFPKVRVIDVLSRNSLDTIEADAALPKSEASLDTPDGRPKELASKQGTMQSRARRILRSCRESGRLRE